MKKDNCTQTINASDTKSLASTTHENLFEIDISDIKIDPSLQSRAKLNDEIIEEYAEQIQVGAKFPPVIVFEVGESLMLVSGFHRIHAAQKAGLKTFEAKIKQGSRAEALKFSLGQNFKHGLRRTNDDKRHAVCKALGEWPNLSDVQIANICAVSNTFVGNVRREIQHSTVEGSTRVGADGKTRKLPAKKEAGTPNDVPITETVQPQLKPENPVPAQVTKEVPETPLATNPETGCAERASEPNTALDTALPTSKESKLTFGPALPSMFEVSEQLKFIYSSIANPTRQQECLRTVAKVQRALTKWTDWAEANGYCDAKKP